MGGGGGAEIESVLDAYMAAWNALDADARQRLLDRAVVDDFVLDGPTGCFRGRVAVERLIAALQERMPGGLLVRTGPATSQDGAVEFGWQIRTTTGDTVMGGTDVAQFADDGRLRRVEVKTGSST